MGRFEPYSRRELKRRRADWLRRNAVVVCALSALVLAMAVVASVVVVQTGMGSQGWYILGALHVALVAVVAYLIQLAFLAHDREAIKHVRGAWGEENTRSELRRAQRRRLIWGSVDSIGLWAGDLDHVVVTRRGGLLVLDSKWRNDVDKITVADMARDACRAKLRAEGVARTLLKKERGAHRARVESLSMTPVVVLWGASQRTVPDTVVDGVTFVAGRDLVAWLRGLSGAPVDKESAFEALSQLRTFREGVEREAAQSARAS